MFELRDINISYGDVHVVFDVNLKIERGEIISLVGSNGAGKTTILKTISGLVKPSSGNIIFNGKHLEKLSPAQIVDRGISQVPEGRKLFGSMTVENNLTMGAVSKHARANIQENIKKVISLFPILEERKRQLAGSLSGGEQQMLAIARCLMSDPQLLIMDEPSLGVAPLLVKSILGTVVKIRNEGTTVLLVEQNLVQALKISDRCYIIETGRIVQTGSGSELLNDENIRKKYLGI